MGVLVADYLTHLPFDEEQLRMLPKEVVDSAAPLFTALSGPDHRRQYDDHHGAAVRLQDSRVVTGITTIVTDIIIRQQVTTDPA